MNVDVVTGEIIDAAVNLHKQLGPGLLESVYATLLADKLRRRGLAVERQKRVPLEFIGRSFDIAFRVDMLVNELVVVELKSASKLAEAHWKQLLTYLRLMNLPVGLLLNFGAPVMRDGIRRVVNNYDPAAP